MIEVSVSEKKAPSHQSIDERGDPLYGALQLERELRAMAVRLTRSEFDAGDLLQDTFERALRSRTRYTPGTNLRAWLRTIMHNLYVDGYRHRHRSGAPLEAQTAEPLPAPDADSRPVWEKFTMDDVRRATGVLGAPLRTVLELSAFEGLPYGEISRRLGIPVATVSTRLLRARLKLRQVLAERSGAPPLQSRMGERSSKDAVARDAFAPPSAAASGAKRKGQEAGCPTSRPPMFLQHALTAQAPTTLLEDHLANS